MVGPCRNRVNDARQSRSVTALLSAVLLNLAMIPCGMALEGERSCPGCPTEHHAEAHAGHAEHKEHSTPATQADCCELDTFNVEDRSQQGEKDGADKTPPILFTGLTEPAAGGFPVFSATGPPDPDPSPPPIHILNCVFLD